MYATEGTDIKNNFSKDMKANTDQLFGDSEQYTLSKDNAILISDYVHNTGGTLVFVGHSLGGGLASYNALATGWDAFTYNAAGLSYATKAKLNQTFTPKINATVIKGEIIDKLQSIIGLQAESSSSIHYINGPSTFWINLLDHISNYSLSPKLEDVAEHKIGRAHV